LQKTWLCADKTPVRPGTPDCPVVHRIVSGGAPDSVRCARLVRVNLPLSGFDGGVRLKFTGLSGGAPDCPVSQWSPAPTVGHEICGQRVAAPTVDRVHRTVRCAPDSVRCANGPRGATVGYAYFGRRSCTGLSTGPIRWHTGLSGAPLDRRQDWPSKLVSNSS
jgi:hypothetical protein